MGVSDRLAHDTITDRQREWLVGLSLTLQVVDGVLAFHRSPTVADDASGQWRAGFRTVAHDGDQAATIAEGNGRLDVARALRT
jgi:hypothetical protein